MIGAGLVAAGFTDYPLMAFHFQRIHQIHSDWIPLLYALAMGVSGAGSLLFGRLFDRFGFNVIVALTLASAVFAPLIFFGSLTGILIGVCLWGLGMGVHESIIPAAVAPMVSSERRASSYGLFTAVYGLSWFLGSIVIGLLYNRSLTATVSFCMVTQLIAVGFLLLSNKPEKKRGSSSTNRHH
jgi:predicted MFS family arabinose efflux permease